MPEDYPTKLNNLLQNLPSGNVACHLRYEFEEDGPSDKATHTATAMFRGKPYGVGTGTSKSTARSAAAEATYDEFVANGVPGPEA